MVTAEKVKKVESAVKALYGSSLSSPTALELKMDRLASALLNLGIIPEDQIDEFATSLSEVLEYFVEEDLIDASALEACNDIEPMREKTDYSSSWDEEEEEEEEEELESKLDILCTEVSAFLKEHCSGAK